MKKITNIFTAKRNAAGIFVTTLLSSGSALAAIDVSAEAAAFEADFLAAAAVIGAAFLAAGFGAIVWKWAKGMLFS